MRKVTTMIMTSVAAIVMRTTVFTRPGYESNFPAYEFAKPKPGDSWARWPVGELSGAGGHIKASVGIRG